MVRLYEGAKPHVIIFASRTRHPFLIIEVAGEWHTKHQWPRVNPCERAQEQFQIDPVRGRIHVVPKCYVTTTTACFFLQTWSYCNFVRIGSLGSADARNKLRPIERLYTARRGRPAP